jgi:hypothetical protein
MTEISTDQLKRAVESQHGGAAEFVQSLPIHQEAGGKTVWNGAVQVYDLLGQPDGATRAYAWSYSLPNGNRRILAILHSGPITGDREAVRARIVAEAKASK